MKNNIASIACFIFSFFNCLIQNNTPVTLVVHKPTEIVITKVTTTAPTNPPPFTGDIKCVQHATSHQLGAVSNVKFIYVDTKDQNAISLAFNKYESTADTSQVQITLLNDVTKSIVFTDTNVYKILLVGSKDEECYKNYLITSEEKSKQFVHLTHIKCILIDEVKAYYERTKSTEKKPYIAGTKHICFVASLLNTPICIEASDKTKSYTMIISPFPQPDPKCETPSKTCTSGATKTNNISANGTETAKQSAAPIIISVVVIIVVIIAGGVGYVMMKK